MVVHMRGSSNGQETFSAVRSECMLVGHIPGKKKATRLVLSGKMGVAPRTGAW